jgi:hypothetical protein
MLLHQIDAGTRPLDLAAGSRGHREPLSARLAQVFDRLVHGAVLLDQGLHHIADRLKQPGILGRLPGWERENVVTAAGLRLGGDRQEVLVTLRRDVVDRDLDLFLRRPFFDDRSAGFVGAGHPVIPEADRELAGGVSTADIRCGDEGGGRKRSGLQCSSPGES